LRFLYFSFVENQKQIETGWDKTFGYRKNEIVFIGQEMDEQVIKADLDKCLSTAIEIANDSWKKVSHDSWPVARVKHVD
tara:strand:- start:819 stop:1055 length:237 start_codon:yes stop_codon:yes gene_type:complete